MPGLGGPVGGDPDGGPTITVGAGQPVTGPILGVQVTIPRLVHTYPDDVDIMLVSPANRGVVLMSDVGASIDFDGSYPAHRGRVPASR